MKARLISVLPLVALPFVFGCDGTKRDFENICYAEQRSGAASIADPAAKADAIGAWLRDNVKTREAKQTLGGLANVGSSDEKSRVLRDAAKAAGVADCPLADYKPSAAGSSSAPPR